MSRARRKALQICLRDVHGPKQPQALQQGLGMCAVAQLQLCGRFAIALLSTGIYAAALVSCKSLFLDFFMGSGESLGPSSWELQYFFSRLPREVRAVADKRSAPAL